MARYEDETLREVFNPVSRKPAVRFEMLTGLSGISQEYVFPDGMNARAFENFYFWRGGNPPPVYADHPDMPESAIKKLGGDIDSFLDRSSPQLNKQLGDLWDKMLVLNPVLADINVDKANTREMYDALLGTASAFNIDDIAYYLELRRERRPAALESLIHPLNTAIREKTGCMMEWAPSSRTMERVAEAVSKEEWKKPARDDIVKRVAGYRF